MGWLSCPPIAEISNSQVPRIIDDALGTAGKWRAVGRSDLGFKLEICFPITGEGPASVSITIPIFPLNTVLFPGAPLPLRIFEPRYRQMLERCIESDRRFGVSLIKSGQEVGGVAEPFDVGTVARIGSVRPEENGAIPISTRGEERFRIVNLDHSGEFLRAEIEILSEDLDTAAGPVAKEARKEADEYIRLLLTVNGEWHRIMKLPSDPLKLSYFLGTVLLGLDVSVRQEMLEADPVSKRLNLATEAISIAGDELRESIMRAGPGNDRTVFGIN